MYTFSFRTFWSGKKSDQLFEVSFGLVTCVCDMLTTVPLPQFALQDFLHFRSFYPLILPDIALFQGQHLCCGLYSGAKMWVLVDMFLNRKLTTSGARLPSPMTSVVMDWLGTAWFQPDGLIQSQGKDQPQSHKILLAFKCWFSLLVFKLWNKMLLFFQMIRAFIKCVFLQFIYLFSFF